MIELIKDINILLNKKERQELNKILLIALIVALLDALGIASVMPFIAAISSPEVIQKNAFTYEVINAACELVGLSNVDFILLLGGTVFCMLLLTQLIKALAVFKYTNFALGSEHTIGARLVQCYITQPYEWYLNKNSAEIGKRVLSEVTQVIGGALLPMINLISQGAVLVAITILLILVNKEITFYIIGFFSMTYLILYKITNLKLKKIGKQHVEENKKRFITINEVFGAIKEVKIHGLESTYLKKFSDSAENYAKHQASSTIIAQLPKYCIEMLAFGGLILIILYQLKINGGLRNSMPEFGLYAFAGYRILPAMQQIYSSLTQLNYCAPALSLLTRDSKELNKKYENYKTNDEILFNEALVLKGVNFSYGMHSKVLKNINISIKKNTTVAFVGKTGSGKTTLVDVILGLLKPNSGGVYVDSFKLNANNMKAWQNKIGYVPQQIYLSDVTIAENIAFGCKKEEIDMQAVINAARLSNIHEFINNDLPEKYLTEVGERGVRLSGGQRQRIGIARALYKSPELLVLDEATNALDRLTEDAVIDAINNLNHKITIILVMHRIESLKQVDNIFLIESGEITHQGGYINLSKNSALFQTMSGQ